MADIARIIRGMLDELGIAQDGTWSDLPDLKKEKVLKKIGGRLPDLLNESDYASMVETLGPLLDDPAAEAKRFVKEVLERWLKERGLTPSDSLADTLIKAFSEPDSVFAKYEWVTMPRRWPDAKQQYYAQFKKLRAFILTWDQGRFATFPFADPNARPAIFAAASCVRVDTPLRDLACSDASTGADALREAELWLQAVDEWGHQELGKPSGWLGGIDAREVATEETNGDVVMVAHVMGALLAAR